MMNWLNEHPPHPAIAWAFFVGSAVAAWVFVAVVIYQGVTHG